MTTPTMTITVEQAIKRRFFIAMDEICETLPENTGVGGRGKKAEFARSIGWNVIALYMCESEDRRNIPVKYLAAICEVYKVDANWLLTGKS